MLGDCPVLGPWAHSCASNFRGNNWVIKFRRSHHESKSGYSKCTILSKLLRSVAEYGCFAKRYLWMSMTMMSLESLVFIASERSNTAEHTVDGG